MTLKMIDYLRRLDDATSLNRMIPASKTANRELDFQRVKTIPAARKRDSNSGEHDVNHGVSHDVFLEIRLKQFCD